MAAMNPSPTKPVVRYPTALLEDKELVTIHDSRLPDYKALEYGTLYPDQNKFPGLKLIFQEPLDDDRMVRRVWAGDRKDQDLYNADRKYSGGSTEHPILIRRYLFPEDGYEPLATGTPDSQFPEAVLVEEEVAQPENRNGYLAVTRVFETLPGPLLTGVQITPQGQIATITTQVVEPGTTVAPSATIITASVKPDSKGKSVLEKIEVAGVFGEQRFTAEKPEVVPTQFRAAVPEETTEQVVAGVAEMPMLGEGDKAASEEQVTVQKKRVRRTRRDLSDVSETLVDTNIDEAGIVETITKTLKTGGQTVNPTATLRGQVEELGDNLTLKTEVEKEEVFPGKVFAAERPDPVPEKFRVAVPTKTVEETAVGTAGEPALAGGEIAESEQQVTKFVKRTRKVTRDRADFPKKLPQTGTGPQSQKLFVDETLQLGNTQRRPSVTVDVESQALGDGTYVVRTEDGVELFTGPTYTAEVNDPTPQKFRSNLPIRTEERNEVGVARKPELKLGEVSKSFQQIDAHTVRRRTVKKAPEVLPVSHTQVSTNPQGLKVKITETLQKGDTAEEPSATRTIESEALGDGNYVVRRSEFPEVFSEQTTAVERPDNVPQKFRSRLPTTTSEETVAGTATTPKLLSGELAASEQQITKHTKRRRRVSRQATSLPQTLTQTSTNDKGQLVTVQETYQEGDTSETPSATTVIESEALGDGTYVVRKSAVNQVFSGKQLEVQRTETLPERFRAAIPTISEEETVAGSVSGGLTLSPVELAVVEQQVSEHTKRKRRVTRNISNSPVLKGQNYDPTFNVVYPFQERITASGAAIGRPNTEVAPISGTEDLVREFDPKTIADALNKISLEFPSRASLSLPPVLKKIELVWDVVQESGNYNGSGTGKGIGDTWSWDAKGQGEARAVAGVTPGWVLDIEEVWASGVPTTSYIFFLPFPVTEQHILSRLKVSRWPVFRPKSHSLVAFGKKITATENASGSSGQSRSTNGASSSSSFGKGVSFGASTSAVSIRVPPCLHANITVREKKSAKATAGSKVNVGTQIAGFDGGGNIVTQPIVSVGTGATANAQSSVNIALGQTSPEDIPRSGRYLIDSKVEPYQYGFARVIAEVLDAGVFR